MRARALWGMVFVMLGLAPGARAQTAADLEEGIRLEPGAVEGEYTLKWWGKAGRTYFIETSEDLLHWTYLPVIEAGTDGVIQWGFGSLAEGCFLRLRHTDTATGGDALTADFDGDGVSNMAELQAGFDPLDAQSTPPVSPLIADLPAGSPRVWPFFDDYPDSNEYLLMEFKRDTSTCVLQRFQGAGGGSYTQYKRIIYSPPGNGHSEGFSSTPYPEAFDFTGEQGYYPTWGGPLELPGASHSAQCLDFDDFGNPGTWVIEATSNQTRLHLSIPLVDRRSLPWTSCPMVKQFAKFKSDGTPYNDEVITRLFPRVPLDQWPLSGHVTTNDMHCAAPSEPDVNLLLPVGTRLLVSESYTLREVNYLPQSFSLSDSAGPAHRKIGLNGFPLSDAKPQAQDESGELKEETFVDAYSLQLRHSVSDVYVSTDSTLLPLQVRRSVTPEAWSRRFGGTPEERMDRPFGPGWSSNLVPFISFEKSGSGTDTSPEHIHLYERAVVTDEQGGQRTFLRSNSGAWLGTREAGQSAKTSFDRLEQTGPGTFVLRQKFGTTCYYELIFNSQGKPESRSRPADRLMASKGVRFRAYARMTQVVDRLGNRLVYTYPDSPNLKSLIPHTIHDPARPAHRISIQQDDGLVIRVQGADGELIHYEYEDMSSPGSEPLPAVFKVLSRVSRSGPGQAMPETGGVSYGYDASADHDPTPDPADAHETEFIHLELGSITDERGHNHQFSYRDGLESVFDRGWEYEIFSGDGPSGYEWRIQTGLPRLLTRITLPDARTVHFSGDRGARVSTQGLLSNTRCATTVTGDCGTYTYIFDDPYHYQPFVDHGPSGGLIEYLGHQATLTFTRLQICHGTGAPADPRETFTFSPAAGMAPATVTDLDGRTTTFEYGDEAQVIPNLPGVLMPPSIHHDDPTAEVSPIHDTLNAWGQPMNGRKTFTYDPATRVMTSMTDPRGVRTIYKLKPALAGQRPTGLRVKETVTDENLAVLRVTDFEYNHPVFKGFMTRQILRTTGLPTEAQAAMGEMITTFTPDINGRIATQSVALGGGQPPAVTSFTYTGSGMKQTVTDPRQHTTTFEYEPDTLRLKKVTHPDLSFRQLFYDAHGNLEREVNEIGVTTFHDHDVFNRRIKTTLDLNGNGLKDPRYTQFTPAAGGQPATYNGDIVTETTYTVHHLPEDEWDARGIRTRHTHDTLGRRLTTTVNFGAPDPAQVHTTRFTDDDTETPDFVGGSVFNVSGFKPLRVTDPRGFTTAFEYDALYRVTKTTLTDTSYNPAQVIETRTRYDDAGNPVLTLDALERGTHTNYDGLGRATTVTYPSDANTPAASIHTFYTPGGQVWKSVDETGAITRHTYDQAGRVKTTTLPAVLNPATGQPQTPLIQHTHDAAGNLTHVEDPRGNTTQTLYDNRNRTWKVIQPQVTDATTGQPAAPATLTHYDDAGRVTGQTDPLGHFTQTVLDRAGRALQTIAPQIGAQTHITRRSFDAAGNILTLTDPEGHTVTNTYDAHNRLRSTLDAEAILNEFEYDKNGNRTLARDGLQQETTFTYDAQNRPLTQTHANLDTWSWTYNALQKTGQVDAKQVATTYTYDARDRLRTLAAPGIERLHTYDLAGRLLTVSETGRPEAAITNTWDAHGRLMSETSRGLTHSHAYDLAGNRVATTYSTGRNVTTTHDAHNRPATITEGGRVTTYGYDKAGRAVLMTAGNSQTTNNTYDALGRLTDRTLFQTPAMQETEVLVQLGWQHDAAGNVLAQHETWPGEASRGTGIRSTLMGYDNNYRLTSETIQTRPDAQSQPVTQSTTTYTYNDANNRATKTVTRHAASSTDAGENDVGHWIFGYNNANQLTSWEKWDEPSGTLLRTAALTYDDNGNRASQSITQVSGQNGSGTHPPAAATGQTLHTWDALDRLTGVETPDGTQHTYTYDHRTRRIGLLEDNGTLAKHTALTFTGGLSTAEWEEEDATPDLNTAPTVEYQRGPDMGGGVGGLLYSLRTGTAKYNLSNGRGDIIAQSDQTAALTWTASYEANGKRTKETGANADKQRGNSKDEDPTGLLNEGRRYRCLETGVWLSRDPAGFVDGLNLYAYVRQNPWSKFDPLGLAEAGQATLGQYYTDAFFNDAEIDHHRAANTPDLLTGGAEVLGTAGVLVAVAAPGPMGAEGAGQIAGKAPGLLSKIWGKITKMFGKGEAVVEDSRALMALKNADLNPTSSAAGNWEKAQAAADQVIAATRTESGGSDALNMSKRLEYMGRTPGKSSSTGRSVIERMMQEGKARSGEGGLEILNSEGQWVAASSTDMSHIKDAVKAWNEGLNKTGPRSPEVRQFMKDPSNYELDSSNINRSKGAKLRETYIEPETITSE